MKKLFRVTTVLFAILSCSMLGWATSCMAKPIEKNYFQFAISKYHTSRQSGQTVDIHVRYAYKKNLPTTKYPDYRILRTVVLHYMEPSDEFPADIYWEILATQIGRELMHNFPLQGVSVQLHVLDNPEGNEPGDHGPTFTIGNIAPLDVH